jgi:hypothetical protein
MHPIDAVRQELQHRDRQRSRLLRAMESKAATVSPAMLSASNYFQIQIEQSQRAHKFEIKHHQNKARKVSDPAGFVIANDRKHACVIPKRFSSAGPRRRPARRFAQLLLDRLGPPGTAPHRAMGHHPDGRGRTVLLANTSCRAGARRRLGRGTRARPHPHAGLPPATQRGACPRHSLRTGASAQPGASWRFNTACAPKARDVIGPIDRTAPSPATVRGSSFLEV